MKNIVFPETKTLMFGDIDVGVTFVYNGKAYTKMHPMLNNTGLNAFCHSDSECKAFRTHFSVHVCPDAELLLEGRDE